jgi:hypothetical protein
MMYIGQGPCFQHVSHLYIVLRRFALSFRDLQLRDNLMSIHL